MSEMIRFVEGLSENILGSALVRYTAAFSDGNALYAIRYATDRKAPTLYASPVGKGYCLVSEPLNDDVDAWAEIPDGSAVTLTDKGLDVTPFQPVATPAKSTPVAIPA
jgi:glutamine amidotransferase